MSTPRVGSSKSRIRGSMASARPISTFCWLPPLSVHISAPGLHHVSRVTGLGGQTENSPTGEPTQIRDCGVLADRAIGQQPLRLPVLRHIGDAESGGGVWAPYSRRPTKHLDRSRD